MNIQNRFAETQNREDGLSRRQFVESCLFGASLPLLSTSSIVPATSSSHETAVILLVMLGGPSTQETFDPKPDAPSHVRGPFSAIPTRLPGVSLSEHFPRLAQRMHRLCLVRSLHHDAAPIHETGLQLLQTGRLIRSDQPGIPDVGMPANFRTESAAPPFAVLPSLLGSTGVAVSRGQEMGALGMPGFPRAAVIQDPESASDAQFLKLRSNLTDLSSESRLTRDLYGPTRFGRDCLRARRMVEAGSRLVIVNMYSTVFGTPSWDVHGKAPFSSFEDYQNTVCPAFDHAFTALVDDLQSRGLLSKTLVVAAGEFGRTPVMNESGGRDHWPRAACALLAGGPAPAGLVIGETDPWGGEPTSNPVHFGSLYRTMASHLGVNGPEAALSDAYKPTLATASGVSG